MDTALFQRQFRIASARKKGCDYGEDGRYFVTICTKNRKPWLGEIRNGIMGLSETGCVVAEEWQRTAIVRPNVQLGAWVIMPDHLHVTCYVGAVEIDWWSISHPKSVAILQRFTSSDVAMCLPLARRRSGDLGSIIAQFKAACTRRIREMGHTNFAWQHNYYDRIIRNDEEYTAIEKYILGNPSGDRPPVDLYIS